MNKVIPQLTVVLLLNVSVLLFVNLCYNNPFELKVRDYIIGVVLIALVYRAVRKRLD